MAEAGDTFTTPHGKTDARLRVIFDNGAESNMLMRSLQRALNGDETARRITDPFAGPLFSEELAEDDQASGTIYVLRSKSDHPLVAANRDLVHKIGVTNMMLSSASRARACSRRSSWPTSRSSPRTSFTISIESRLENLIHKIFQARPARYSNQRPVRTARRSEGVVSRPAVCDRRGRQEDKGRHDRRLRL